MVCPFCDLSKIAGPVADFGDVIAFEPLNPVVPGHTLIVPRKHVSDFADDPAVSARAMAVAAQLARTCGGDFNLITSKGEAATQSVRHLHLHLVPRQTGDGLSLPWTTTPNPAPEEKEG